MLVDAARTGAQRHQQLALLHGVADGHRQTAHDAIPLGEHLVLHLHRLEHHDRSARRHLLLVAVGDRHDHTGEGCQDIELGLLGHGEIIAEAPRAGRPSRTGAGVAACPRAVGLRARAGAEQELASLAMSSAMPPDGGERPPSQRREALKQVFARARGCERCAELAATRKTVVFGAGNADAELMFVGEAPGASEDEQGVPFVGRAGKLLEQLLGEIGLARAEVFIANVLKCRPPGNRDPLPVEIDNCQEYLLAPGRADRADRDLHARQLLDQAAARRPDRDHAPARAARDARCSGQGACACTRSTTPRRRCTRRACSRRCARTSRGCRSCSRSARPRSHRRSRARASSAGPGRPAPEPPAAEPVPRAREPPPEDLTRSGARATPPGRRACGRSEADHWVCLDAVSQWEIPCKEGVYRSLRRTFEPGPKVGRGGLPMKVLSPSLQE